MRITSDDHARIAGAIKAAETRTTGEIFCVLAKQSAPYHDVSLAWAAAAALIAPLGLIPLGFSAAWFPGIGDNWEAAHTAAREVMIGRTLAAYGIVQAAIFIGTFLLASIPTIRRLLTPSGLRRGRVHRAAMEQFLAHGIHVTEGRTGVLIYAALGDHVVEVVADKGIHARVEPQVWGDVVTELSQALKAGRPGDGFVAAVERCGEILAGAFPPGARNPNELADRLIEL